MPPYKFAVVVVVLLAGILFGNGNSHAGAQTESSNGAYPAAWTGADKAEHKIKFSAQISFGDSLSDVGTYAVGTVAALGGGQFTVNGPKAKNWTAVMAQQFGLPAPCAAQTGLDGDPYKGFSVMPPVNHPGCTSYAQGGARVSEPVGVGNKWTGGASATVGFLTLPIAQQVINHLAASGGKFRHDEIVFVMAGANDVFFQLGLLQMAATTPAAAINAVHSAATELAEIVNTRIVGAGAKYVVVVNVPDITITPFANSLDAAGKGLVYTMLTTFNSQLQSGIANTPHVLYVDAFADSHNQFVNPAQYGLSNVTDTACDLSPAKNPLGSSLVCSAANVVSGNTAQYLFADGVHPTPYGYALIAQLVRNSMHGKGWRWHDSHRHGSLND